MGFLGTVFALSVVSLHLLYHHPLILRLGMSIMISKIFIFTVNHNYLSLVGGIVRLMGAFVGGIVMCMRRGVVGGVVRGSDGAR